MMHSHCLLSKRIYHSSPSYMVPSDSCPGSKRAKDILGCMKHNTDSWSKDGILLLYLVLAWPHLEYFVQFWAPQCTKDDKVLESI